MSINLIEICYQDEFGSTDIRTCNHEGVLHVSLRDIFLILSKENRNLNEKYENTSLADLVLGQVNDLDSDEYIMVPTLNPEFRGQDEVFVTQPGFYRVISNNKSKAGKKFQKWLFHEVIPSISKHGCYPPPPTPQGSALSQMAEILAQNSRALADTIIRQEILENEVNIVKAGLKNVTKRIDDIELENANPHIITVNERLIEKSLILDQDKIELTIAWSENLTLNKGRKKINCPSGRRENTRFEVEIIDIAILMALQTDN